MKDKIILIAIGFFILGTLISLRWGNAEMKYNHHDAEEAIEHGHKEGYDHEDSKVMLHSHSQHEVSENVLVDLVVHKDPKSGYNAEIILQGMKFAPENASGEHVEGEGHAHIYIDGVRINRVYGLWYYLGDIDPGMHEVTVTLSTNDHRELIRNGDLVADTEVIVVK